MIGVCRFCGCTDEKPCLTRMAKQSRLAEDEELVIGDFPCSWLLPDLCDAPACVEKAYLDARLQAEELDRLLENGLRWEAA